jgi:carbonic anhydrase
MNYGPFDDVIAANAKYAEQYSSGRLEPRAAKLLCVLTCMDSRIDPLRMLGFVPGDAKILRNAGARVTDDVLGNLVVAHYLLGAARFMIVAHTGCAMASGDEESIHKEIAARGGPDTHRLRFLTTDDQDQAVRDDVERVRSFPFLENLTVGGFAFDLETGRLRTVC